MPRVNIELHGYNWSMQFEVDQANEMQRKIWDVLQSADYYNDVAVSYGNCQVVTADCSLVPHLRIWVSDPRYIDNLLLRLEPLDIDIEGPIVLPRYIESRSSRQQRQGALPLEPPSESWWGTQSKCQ